jgi:Lrp/AsnC family transcriptional regulator, regulator for asnA, asnC and gidA
MSAQNLEIDKLDMEILSILMSDAQIPYTEIAKKVFVSGGTVHVRVKKLTEMGLIVGSQVNIEPELLGYGLTAFIGIFLNKSSMYDSVVDALKAIPEVVGCNYTTGTYSMFVKILCRDTNHLKRVLHDKLQYIEGINRTETLISLEESINRPLQLLKEND